MANINAGPFTTRPEIDGTFGVVASTHWIGTAVGMGVLERGGNAFDAGIATAFTLQVVEPHLCGPGGDVPVMLYDAKAKKPIVVCGQGPAPAGATHRPLPRPPGARHRPRHRPAAGLRAGHVRDLHDDPARLRHAPAARRAGARHRLRPQRLSAGRARLRHHLHRREALPRALADLGRRLSARRQGAGAELAVHQRQACRDLRAHPEGSRGRRRRARGGDRAGAARLEPGLRRRDDRRLLPHQRGDGRERPARTRACSPPRTWRSGCRPRGAGPPRLRQLSRAQAARLDARARCCCRCWRCSRASTSTSSPPPTPTSSTPGWSAPSSPTPIARPSTAIPKFVDVPMQTLLSEAYNAERRKLVGARGLDGPAARAASRATTGASSSRARGRPRAGAGEPTFARLHTGHGADEQQVESSGKVIGDTVHIDIIDKAGNMFTSTPSGGWLQSSPVIPALGWPLGSRGQMFWLDEGLPGSLAPGKRPRSSLSVGMALRDGQALHELGHARRRPAGPVELPVLPAPRAASRAPRRR